MWDGCRVSPDPFNSRLRETNNRSFVFINVPFSQRLEAGTMENICIIIRLLIHSHNASCSLRNEVYALLICLLLFSLAHRICSLQSVCATNAHNDSIYIVSMKSHFLLRLGTEGLLSPPLACAYRRSREPDVFLCADWLAHPFSSFCVFHLIWEIWWSSLAFFLALSHVLSLFRCLLHYLPLPESAAMAGAMPL